MLVALFKETKHEKIGIKFSSGQRKPAASRLPIDLTLARFFSMTTPVLNAKDY